MIGTSDEILNVHEAGGNDQPADLTSTERGGAGRKYNSAQEVVPKRCASHLRLIGFHKAYDVTE